MKKIFPLIAACLFLQLVSCSGSKKTTENGPTIAQNQIPAGKSIADLIAMERVLVLRPIMIVRGVSSANQNAQNPDWQARMDSMARHFSNTFDSVFRFTVQTESIAKMQPAVQMPLDSLHTYDSLMRLAALGSYELALVPDKIEIRPNAAAEAGRQGGGRHGGGRGAGMGGGRGGGNYGGGEGPGSDDDGGARPHRGPTVTVICNYTIVRASDNKTMFSGAFTVPNVGIGGAEAANTSKALCEQFITWRSPQ